MSDLYGIAKSGLQAYKESLATTGQNIANVGNENYSRREAKLGQIKVASADVLSISSNTSFGVKVESITRAFDQFIDMQLQSSSSDLSFATSQTLILQQLETVLRPNDTTIAAKLHDFFSDLSTVSQDPSDLAARNIAIDSAKAVVNSIRNVANGITDLRRLTSESIIGDIEDFNAKLSALNTVQKEILGKTSIKATPNDILDQRDTLLKDLSELAAITVDYNKDGSVKLSIGTTGQGQVLLDGLTHKKLKVQTVNGGSSIFLDGEGSGVTKLQVQAGEIAGFLAADINLKEAKSSLDDLTKRLVSEFNEVHKFGVDLDGTQGSDFFYLDAVEIQKESSSVSTSQLRIEGVPQSLVNNELNVVFDASSNGWNISDQSGKILHNFAASSEFNGLRFSIDGEAALGDRFTVKFSDNNSANLQILITDGKRLAASSYYSIEPNPENLSDAKLELNQFEPKRVDNLSNLEQFFSDPRDSANSVNFVNTGVLGYLSNVDDLKNFTSLKSQAKIYFGVPISELNTNTKLKISLGSNEHVFSIGDYVTNIESYSEITRLLNSGAIKSDSNNLSFSDLGLYAGGDLNGLTVSSDEQSDNAQDGLLKSGSLNSVSGIFSPADTGDTGIQVFTREGLQLAGVPLSNQEATDLLSEENGFSSNASYSAKYLAIGNDSSYIGADISRFTTAGLDIYSISAKGFNDHLAVYAGNAFPTSRTSFPNLTITTSAGYVAEIAVAQGMMAGQIAGEINSEAGQFGVKASASNILELYDIPDGRLQFDILGESSAASKIDISITNGNTSGLISAINAESNKTGVVATASGTSAILLKSSSGNEIALKDFSITGGNTISMRQIDDYGEAIQSSPKTISDGQHIISGGQINIKSPLSFSLEQSSVTKNSSKSAFDDGFIHKLHDQVNNKTVISFLADSKIDANSLDENGSQGVAASSSYGLTIGSETAGTNITATVKPKNINDFSSSKIAGDIVSELRSVAPKTRFAGDDFVLSDGFPESGSSIEFVLGEQKYTATLNMNLDYTLSGSNVFINNESLSYTEGLKRLVAASTFAVTGPEKDRVTVGFEESGSGFRLFAAAKDGVLTGHALIVSDNNSIAQKDSFHISDTSSFSTILSSEIDLTTATKNNFADIVIGASSYSLSFDTTSDSVTVNPALPSTVSLALVSTGTDKAKLQVSVANGVSNKEIRLKANDDSASFGIVTAGTQLTLVNDGIEMSNYRNQRVNITGAVNSLANEVISFEGLAGEDLIIFSNGNRRAKLIGEVSKANVELNPREMEAIISEDNLNSVDIFDKKSGDLLGSRVISDSNNFLFRGFDWMINGAVSAADKFNVLTTNDKKDDSSNLDRLINLATFSESNGRGGYADAYNGLVSDAGFQLRASEQNLETAKIKHDVAVDRKSEFSGVDLDTEAAKLLEQQQAYQALARVLTTAKELLDTLLRSM